MAQNASDAPSGQVNSLISSINGATSSLYNNSLIRTVKLSSRRVFTSRRRLSKGEHIGRGYDRMLRS